MDKPFASAGSSQKYSVVNDDDFEEPAPEESGTRKTTSVLATHEPRQSAWHLAVRTLISREALVVHLIWLLLLILSIFCLPFFTSTMSCPVSRLPSDEVFGESAFVSFGELLTFTELAAVPFRVVNWEQDMGFVKSDPMDGKRWNRSRESGPYWTPWDDIHPGELDRLEPSEEP